MDLTRWIVLGLATGLIARFLLPGRDPGGLVVTTLIGVAGSFLGSRLSARYLHQRIVHDFGDPANWVASVAGAAILVVVFRTFFGTFRD
ncbi:GlsB/YeaQ/YmgE family stress response membrane protein [Kitasatospora sp. LaBMicrA B282]|uniref:GlsB/YeaQ/YmgE family stress response membrane protein n=1 Tax=Kitasatospora sp. LaBMicrA B282 TaxID=3420949 RepID=UPI003D0B852B